MTNIHNFIKNRKAIGAGLLAASFVIGLISLTKGQFGDEADNLVVGSLLLKNYTLYSDVFSHHFPFPYYWTALMIGLFGKSLFMMRFSVLAFQTLVFIIGMRISRNYLLVGVTAIIWSILRSYYKGNMVLYNSFASAALVLVLLTTMVLLQQHIVPNWKHFLIIGVFSVIAFLSDPLSVYAIAIAVIFIFTKKPTWGIYVGLVIVAGLSLYLGYLLISGSFQAFWTNAITFNSEIYAKYIYTNPLRIKGILTHISNGLEIQNKAWLNFDPFKPITDEYTALDRWIFTGFLFRFSIITTTIFLALKKKYRAAVFLYLFAASTLIINKWDFRGQPFILVSLVAVSALITRDWWHDTNNKLLKTTQIVVGIVVLLMTGWLCSMLLLDTYYKHETFGEIQFTTFKEESAYIQDLTCGQPNVLLAHYPVGSYYYWFTDMEPVSKFVFMWPWVAEVGLSDVIDELDQEEALAIVVRRDMVVWGAYDTKEYLHPLDEFLETNYKKVNEGIFISPELDSRCAR